MIAWRLNWLSSHIILLVPFFDLKRSLVARDLPAQIFHTGARIGTTSSDNALKCIGGATAAVGKATRTRAL